MNSSIGHILILLFSSVVLFKEGSSNTHNVEERFEDGSQKTQEDEAGGIQRHAGRPLFPQLLQEPQYQLNAQQQTAYLSHHARGVVELDLSNLSGELGIPQIRTLVNQLHEKVDTLSSLLMNTAQKQSNDFNPSLDVLNSKADFLAQASQTLFVGLRSLDNQMKTQQQLLEQIASNKCDNGRFALQFQTLEYALRKVSKEVEDFKIYQSETMKVILQAVVRNSEALTNLQNDVASTYNSCSACSTVNLQSQVNPTQQELSGCVSEAVSTYMSSVTESLQRALHEDMDVHANRVMQQAVQENAEIKSYLLELARKMMDYRDEFITRLLDQGRKMEVIKKTVTETTEVMQKAAAGTQEAADQMVSSAQRSLDDSSMCKNKKVKGK